MKFQRSMKTMNDRLHKKKGKKGNENNCRANNSSRNLLPFKKEQKIATIPMHSSRRSQKFLLKDTTQDTLELRFQMFLDA